MSKILILLFLVSYIVSLSLSTLLPQYRKIKELQKELANKELILETREQYVGQLEESSRKIDEHEEELVKMDYAMPSNPDTSYILEFLNEAVFETGMIFRDIKDLSRTVDRGEESPARQVEVSFRLTGTYDSFLDFLDKVEKTARLIEITSISFVGENLEEEQEREIIEEGFEAPSLFSFDIRLSAPYFTVEDGEE